MTAFNTVSVGLFGVFCSVRFGKLVGEAGVVPVRVASVLPI